MKSPKGHLASFSNSLVDSPFSVRVSIHTLRIVLMAVSRIDSRKSHDEQNTKITITPAEYAELYGVSICNAYKCLSENADGLSQLTSLVNHEDGTSTELPWFKSSKYSRVKISDHISIQVLTLSFSKSILSELTGLSKNFTSINLDQIKRLKHPKSIFLYIHAKRAHRQAEYYRKLKGKKTTFKMELSFYRELLGLGDEYKDFKEFKRRILKPAINEINDCTDIEITAETVRAGRFTTALKINTQDVQRYVRANHELDQHERTRKKRSCKTWKSERVDLIEDKLTLLSQGPNEQYSTRLNELADLYHSLGNPGRVASIERDIRAITAGHDSDYLME